MNLEPKIWKTFFRGSKKCLQNRAWLPRRAASRAVDQMNIRNWPSVIPIASVETRRICTFSKLTTTFFKSRKTFFEKCHEDNHRIDTSFELHRLKLEEYTHFDKTLQTFFKFRKTFFDKCQTTTNLTKDVLIKSVEWKRLHQIRIEWTTSDSV